MNSFSKKQAQRLLLPIFSGLLTGASAYFPILHGIVFISIIPLFLTVFCQNQSRGVVKSVLLYGAGYYPLLFLWFYNLMPQRQETLHCFAVTAGIIIFSALQSFWLCASIFPFVFIKTKKPRDVFIFSFLYILGEWFQEIVPLFPFPWGRLSTAFTSYLPWIQSASIFGNLFLSFLILCINGFLAWIISCKNRREILRCAMLILILAVGNLSFGYFRLSLSNESSEKTAVSFISENDLKGNGSSMIILTGKNKAREIKSVSPNSTVVFWDGEGNEPLGVLLPVSFNKEKAARFKMPYEDEVSFGNFSRWMGIDESFSKRRGISTAPTPYGTAGGIFCYETVYPQKLRKTARQDADFIVAFCDNGANSKGFPAIRNRREAVLRAVETGKPILLAEADSPTIISQNGKEHPSSFKNEAYEGSFYKLERNTIYSVTGDIIVIPSLILWISGIIKLRNSRRKSQEKRN